MTEAADGMSGLFSSNRGAALGEFIERARADGGPGRSPRAAHGRPAPVSYLQEQLWLVDQLNDAQAAAYNVSAALRLTGPLDVTALSRSLTEIIRRHEPLRTVIETHGGVPHQAAVAHDEIKLAVEDRMAAVTRGGEAAVLAEAAAGGREHIDLCHGPVTRFRLFRLAPDKHLLSVIAHQTCLDRWSLPILLSELTALYAAHRSGEGSPLPDPPLQYTEFAAWQRERLSGAELEGHLRFWEKQLAGLPVLDLLTERPRPAEPSYRGALIAHRITRRVTGAAKELARASGASLYTTVMAAFALVLARHTGQEDVVLGAANTGRSRPELEQLVGLLTNMNVLRFDLSGDPAFSELLQRVRRMAAAAEEHGDVPFVKVVERVQRRRDPSRNPLFQVSMEMRPGNMIRESAELLIEAVDLDPGTSRFDIAISAKDDADGLIVSAEYATDLFDRSRIDRMLDHFERALGAVAADPSLRVSQVGLLSDRERTQVLEEWQGEVRPYRRELVHALVAGQAARTPDAEAVVFEGRSLSYAELDRRASALAEWLRSAGVGRGDVVGVALERGLEVPWALLGVLKAGGAFAPVDVSHPAERIGWILSDCAARLVLTTSGLAARLPGGTGGPPGGAGGPADGTGWRVVCLDELELGGRPCAPLEELATLDSPVYVLYTSGSTGRPKGVVLEHHALATYIDFLGNVFGFGPGDRMLQFSSLIFDLAEGELFTGLSRGATVVLVPQEATLSPRALSALMQRERVTYLGAPPAMIALLDPEPYPALRAMLVGGEAFSGDLVNRWNLPGRVFLNAYGPTEAAIGCTYYPCEHKTWHSSPPIGRAMPNRRVYLLDRWGNPVPPGIPGEIVAAGEGLARGYLGRPELTREKFIPDPFHPGDRAYRTGDLATWTPDGQIQFLGRIDTQIKLRGQRIELEEIEVVLTRHPAVAHAVVALRTDLPGGPNLAAYVVPAGAASPPSPAELRQYLATTLPSYMIPAAYVSLTELPLGPTGKINRAALPSPAATDTAHADYVPPRTPTEHLIAAIFTDILSHPHIGANDNFFDLGGNSLQAARIVAHVREQLGTELRVRDVFDSPLVADLATVIDQAATAGPALPESEHLAAEVAEIERQLRDAVERLKRHDAARQAETDAG